jgi:NAD(P)-dependent dehydrogenase (short-subunit alcohol dehydrogenase family)
MKYGRATMDYWQNKVVLVTGAGAGLGRALVTELAARKARTILADRDQQALADVSDQLKQEGGSALPVVADITSQDSVDQLFEKVKTEFGRLDALINCAGRSARAAVLDTTPAMYEELLQLNFFGTMRCARAAAEMLQQSHGHLVNMGSLAAKIASRHLGAYPVSKFAVAAFTHQLRLELGSSGVHVLLVCPGPIARPDAGQRYSKQAEGLPESARKPGGGVRIKGIPPEYLVRRMLQACERRQPELILPGKAKLLFAIAQLWPTWADKIVAKMTR